jgi:hypothetical protein
VQAFGNFLPAASKSADAHNPYSFLVGFGVFLGAPIGFEMLPAERRRRRQQFESGESSIWRMSDDACAAEGAENIFLKRRDQRPKS